jgi:hypothetical protein
MREWVTKFATESLQDVRSGHGPRANPTVAAVALAGPTEIVGPMPDPRCSTALVARRYFGR